MEYVCTGIEYVRGIRPFQTMKGRIISVKRPPLSVWACTYAHTNTVKKKLLHMWRTEAGKNIPPRTDETGSLLPWDKASFPTKKRKTLITGAAHFFVPPFFWGGTLGPKRLPGESLHLLRLQEHFTVHLGRVLQSLPGKKFQKSKSLLLLLYLVFRCCYFFLPNFMVTPP